MGWASRAASQACANLRHRFSISEHSYRYAFSDIATVRLGFIFIFFNWFSFPCREL